DGVAAGVPLEVREARYQPAPGAVPDPRPADQLDSGSVGAVKRAAVLALLALLAVASLAGGASATGGVSLTEAKGSPFPNRSFVLSLPTSRSLTAGDVNVTENGNSVPGVSLISAADANKRAFGVVLVIDSSESMAGKPIDGAMAAARAFASRRNPHQQLALVTFNDKANVALPFTVDPVKI